MMKSSAVLSGSFALTVQFEKLEIHTVFRRFSNFHSCQNLSPITLADFIIGYLSPLTYQCSCRDKNIASGGTSARAFIEGRPKAPFSRFRTISPDTLSGIFLSCLFPRSGTPGKLSSGILDSPSEKHYNVASALFSETARITHHSGDFLWQSPFPATPAAFK